MATRSLAVGRLCPYVKPHLGVVVIQATTDPGRLREADYLLICVPTPVTRAKQPDLEPVRSAAAIVGRNMKRGATVVLESTVYPGVTEEIVIPILEKESGLACGEGFRIGYSPERINPGDPVHTLATVTKVVAGMDPETTEDLAPGLRPRHQGPPREGYPDRRGGKGHREYPAGPEHRPRRR
jgi:nucleotide sugar dehydrogenase